MGAGRVGARAYVSCKGNGGDESSHEEALLEFENVTRGEKDPQKQIGVLVNSGVVRVWSNAWANTAGRIADPPGTLDECTVNSTPPNEIQGRMVGTQEVEHGSPESLEN